jgi:hypothetical protein
MAGIDAKGAASTGRTVVQLERVHVTPPSYGVVPSLAAQQSYDLGE